MSAVKKIVCEGGISTNNAGVLVLSGSVGSVAFKGQTGGRLCYTPNGGAVSSVETQQFLTNTLVTVLQGEGFVAG